MHDAELGLAKCLIEELRVDEFNPTKYHDAFRERLEQAAHGDQWPDARTLPSRLRPGRL